MCATSLQRRVYRFGDFALDLQGGELRKQGIKLKIQGQPLEILAMLLERPGQVVTREEFQKKLWPSDTFVDFEHGLNAAVRRLRDALNDSAETPRYVETLARRGYRFIAPVEGPERAVEHVPRPSKPKYVLAGVLALGLAVGVLFWLNPGRIRGRWGVVASRSQIHSVAVLPLTNLSSDPEQEYFADGMTDSLITDLAKIRSLRVISRTSAMHYKDTKKTLPEVARELGVDAIVEGAVARAGNRVRITAQFIRAENDQHIWAETYESGLSDIFMVQREIAVAVATRIQSEIGREEKQDLQPVRITNPAAYDAFLKGRFYYFKSRDEEGQGGRQKAIDYFSQSIHLDPSYAPAYVGLSDCYQSQAVTGAVPLEVIPKSKAALTRALELDPDLGEAHYSLAFDSAYEDLDWTKAEREFARALQLSPNYALGRQMRGQYLAITGHPRLAIEEMKIAQSLDPLNPVMNVGMVRAYIFARQYDEAIVQAERTLETDPDSEDAHYWLQFAYVRKGMDSAAFNDQQLHLRRLGKKQEADQRDRIYAKGGLKAVLQQDLEFVMTKFPSDSIDIAQSYAELGEKQSAMKYLLKGYRERDPRVVNISVHPIYDPLRSEPEFQDLMARLHYPKP